MGTYDQLTESQRYPIYALKKAGHDQQTIATIIEVLPSTISREWHPGPCSSDTGLCDASGQPHRLRVSRAVRPFWYDITEGFDGVPVKAGMIDVPDRPGLGVELIAKEAKKYLSEGDANFFD
jgi:hypothetical protein